MSRYLELVRAARGARNAPPEQVPSDHHKVVDRRNDWPTGVLDAEVRVGTLLEAGWKPKVRLGRTIWRRPDNGFWVSQEMALHMLNEWNVRDQNGAEARG